VAFAHRAARRIAAAARAVGAVAVSRRRYWDNCPQLLDQVLQVD